MRFDFLCDEANDVIEICERAGAKADEYVKSLGRKVPKKEYDEITSKFLEEEYYAYLNSFQNQKEQVKEESKQDIQKFQHEQDEIDDLEFDEINDILDEDFF